MRIRGNSQEFTGIPVTRKDKKTQESTGKYVKTLLTSCMPQMRPNARYKAISAGVFLLLFDHSQSRIEFQDKGFRSDINQALEQKIKLQMNGIKSTIKLKNIK